MISHESIETAAYEIMRKAAIDIPADYLSGVKGMIDTETGDMLDAIIGGNQTTGLEVSDDGTLLAFSDLLDDRVAVYSVPTTEELLGGGGGRYQDHLTELAK